MQKRPAPSPTWDRLFRPLTRFSGSWYFCFVIMGTLAGGLTATGAESVEAGASPLPEIVPSAVRLLGGLALVLALFLAGVWVFKNRQRLVANSGRVADLRIIEVKALGGRQSLCVVGYRRQRLLIASSPTGVSLLSELPDSVEDEPQPQPLDFASAFRQVLNRAK